MTWDDWARRTIAVPMVIGHEFVGRIVRVGSNVSDFEEGDLVSGEGHVVCGRCRNCMAGRRHLCAHTIGLGVNRPGAFAELVALPVTNIWQHWPGIDEDVAAIFDPAATSRASTKLSPPAVVKRMSPNRYAAIGQVEMRWMSPGPSRKAGFATTTSAPAAAAARATSSPACFVAAYGSRAAEAEKA
jgi:hypothetical protein